MWFGFGVGVGGKRDVCGIENMYAPWAFLVDYDQPTRVSFQSLILAVFAEG